MNLDLTGWVSVSALVEKSKAATVMDKLESIGATDILTTAHLRLRLAYSPTPNPKPTRTASGLWRMEGTLRSRLVRLAFFVLRGFALQSGPALRAECRVSRSYACKRKPRTLQYGHQMLREGGTGGYRVEREKRPNNKK